MKAPLSYVPALPAAIGMIAGIVLFKYCHSAIVPIVFVIASILSFVLRRGWVGFIFTFAFLGWTLSLADEPAKPDSQSFAEKNLWTGVVDDLRATPDAVRLTVKIEGEDARAVRPFKCAVLIPNPPNDFEPGDTVEFSARLYDPQLTADLPDENSYNPKFFTDGITAQANVAPDKITIVGSSITPRRIAIHIQSVLRDLIYRSPVSSQTAWFLSATLLGNDSVLDQEVKQQFRAIGAAHYLALSGFHIGIIAMLASVVFFPIKFSRRFGRMRHLGVIALVWVYAFACGLSPSLVRAAILISIFLFAKIIQRQTSPYNSLCVAAILILCFAPRQLFAPGFQMSFCAVLSILFFAKRINPFRDQSSRSYRIASFFTVPLAAMLGTCIITIFHFHRLPLLFLIPNVLLAMLLPLLLSGGVILMLSTAIGVRFTLLGNVVDYLYLSISYICETLASFRHAEITGIFLPAVSVLLLTLSILLLAYGVAQRRRAAILLSLAIVLISVTAYLLRPQLPQAELYITRQVGRSDIVVRDGKNAMVVTSGSKNDYTMISERLSRRYADFLARRDCNDSIPIVDTDFTMQCISRRDSYIIIGEKTIFFAVKSSPSIRPSVHVDYLLICRASGDKPFGLVKAIKPDTVVIARDMPPVRAARLVDSCRINSQPYIHLTERPFSILIQ